MTGEWVDVVAEIRVLRSNGSWSPWMRTDDPRATFGPRASVQIRAVKPPPAFGSPRFWRLAWKIIRARFT